MDEIKLHEKYMKKVFSLAKKGYGLASPNPFVGAIVVKNKRIIGVGYHKGPGTPHAERLALDMADKDAEGADLYVNLEPCAHFGRTPPCVDAVIKSRVSRVIISNIDPNPLVNGMSVKKLIDNNIIVLTGILEKEGATLNEVFFKYIQKREPFIALKSASSLDGKIATYIGESKWITSESSRKDSHKLRKLYDGILVGINTIIADDPMLTCRIKGGRNPVRIILDTNLKISSEANVLNLPDSENKTIIITSKKADVEKVKNIGKKCKVIVMDDEKISIKKTLKKLGSLNITSVLIEGGSTVHGSFIRENIPDKYYLYYAPFFIGGTEAPGFFGGNGYAKLIDIPKMRLHNIKKLDKDIKIVLYPEKRR